MSPAVLTIDAAAPPALMTSTAPHAVLDVRERATYQGGHIFRGASPVPPLAERAP
jgi:hypothetical protein